MSSVLAVCGIGVACLSLSGCIPATSADTPVPSAAAFTAAAPTWNEVVRDPLYVRPGVVLYGRDLAYRADRLRRHLSGDGYSKPAPELIARMERTIDFLEAPQRARPGVIKFRLEERSGVISWEPLEWRTLIKVRKTVNADVVIVGAEMESLITACTAANAGLRVAVVYSGPLGGLCSDTGGNLRYFDGIRSIPRPAAQYALLSSGLGMPRSNVSALPANVSPLLARYLARQYGRRITLVETSNLNTLHTEVTDQRLSGITTVEGVSVKGSSFIDTDPEGRLAEKCGLRYSVDAPNLASGMVFDLRGLTPANWRRLRNPRSISVDRILTRAGITRDEIAAGSPADVCIRRLEKRQKRDNSRTYGSTAFGFESLAEGYDLYQQARGIRLRNRDLDRLNRMRCTSGFNISLSGRTATFNGVSYHFPTALLQNDHDLLKEPRFEPFRRWERPGLQAYFRFVTGNPRLTVRLPRQFYVRRASALFPTELPYGPQDFAGTPNTRFWMRYPMDLRDALPRDPYEERLMSLIWDNPIVHRRMAWDSRASSTTCRIENLYLLNKSSIPARYYGGLRILQNLINTGTVLVNYLAAHRRKDLVTARSKAKLIRTTRRKAPRQRPRRG